MAEFLAQTGNCIDLEEYVILKLIIMSKTSKRFRILLILFISFIAHISPFIDHVQILYLNIIFII